MLQLIYLLIIVPTSFACQADDGENPGDIDNGQEDPRFAGDLSDPSKHTKHWPVPGGGVDHKQFIRDWQENERQRELAAIKANGRVKSYPDDAGRGWPRHWIGLGLGNGGVPPPPWAIDPKGSGRADMCYMPPRTGHCKRFTIRWGYNAYLGDCGEFVYSGCGGNANNFFTKHRCRGACRGAPRGQCGHGAAGGGRLADYHLWPGRVTDSWA